MSLSHSASYNPYPDDSAGDPSLLVPLFLTVFAMVLLAELADKTQLVTFALVIESGKPRQVYIGVLGGLFTVTAIGVLVGTLIAVVVPLFLIQLIAGIVFLILGGYTIYRARRRQEAEEQTATQGKTLWLRAFILLFLSELGDKTQLVVILIAATTGQLILVFIAAFLALALVNGIGVILGDRARQYLGTTTIAYIAAIAFIVAGAFVILGTILP
jgi:putative Ca2+/H+ antiporter (TMEM165/GDT1 family)